MIAKSMALFLTLIVISILLVLGALYLFQRSLIYFPRILTPDEEQSLAAAQNLEPIRDETGELLAWQTPRQTDLQHRLVVFHGNGSLAVYSTGFVEAAPPGWQIVLAEYPGYGSRSGVPTEASIQTSAGDLLRRLQRDGLPIYVAGESLGSGVASWAAANFSTTIKGVILVTPFPDLATAAAVHYPWVPTRLLLRDRFEAAKALREFQGPVAFVLAEKDTIIPAALGHALHDKYGGSKLLWQQPGAGHNSIDFSPAGWKHIFDFLLRHDSR